MSADSVGHADVGRCEGGEGGEPGAAVERGVGGDQPAKAAHHAVHADRIISAAATGHVRRQDLGVPAAAGPDLDDRVVRPHAEESERLIRMAVAVARGIGWGPAGRGDRRPERLAVAGGEAGAVPLDRGGGGDAQDQEGAGGGRERNAQGLADHLFLPR